MIYGVFLSAQHVTIALVSAMALGSESVGYVPAIPY